jgi:DNA mismatch endonuclease (patch repair protein)
MDIVDPVVRSRMMSGIRGKDTKPELAVRSYLHRSGLRFRLHAKMAGKPDLVFPKYRTVVFVHGCFWHRHEGCRFTTTPANNASFWAKKFADNVRRDARAQRELVQLGWRVLVIWSCQLNEARLKGLAGKIRKGE